MKIAWDGDCRTLTNELAYFLIWKLWAWQAQFGSCNKGEWPHWEQNGGKVAHCYSYCPACEKAGIEFCCSPGCRYCLMSELWGSECEKLPSPYEAWRKVRINDNPDERRKHARIIANFARKKYQECCRKVKP